MRNPLMETTYGVAYRELKDGEALLFESEEKQVFSLLKNTWRYWYADPLVFTYKGEEWLFAEKMDRLTRRGCIAAAPINGSKIGEFQEVFHETYHLSYPMIFEKGGKIYMIPESTAGKCVKLYECIHFPDRWEYKLTLFDNVLYADTNVFCYQNRWYLITGEMDPRIGAKTKTLIFAADRIEAGKLTAIESELSTAFSFEKRGAGNIFEHQGDYIRPIQCGDESNYGRELLFSKLSFEPGFQEQALKRIGTNDFSVETNKKLYGTHTYAKTKDLEIIDVKFQQISNVQVLCSKVLRKLGR